MKISKKLREEAALICQVAASNQTLGFFGSSTLLGYMSGHPAYRLAADAWVAVMLATEEGPDCLDEGEAECLIRTGWSPGEEVGRG